jgi:hypothetical protein
MALEVLGLGLLVTKRVVVTGAEGCLRSMQDEALYALRVRYGQQDGERSSLAPADHVRSLELRGFHDHPRVLHPLVRRGHAGRAVRHAGAALVEANDARERRHLLEPAHPARLIPIEAEMGHPAWDHQQIVWTLADDLVRDVHFAVARVENRRSHSLIVSLARACQADEAARRPDEDLAAVEGVVGPGVGADQARVA